MSTLFFIDELQKGESFLSLFCAVPLTREGVGGGEKQCQKLTFLHKKRVQ